MKQVNRQCHKELNLQVLKRIRKTCPPYLQTAAVNLNKTVILHNGPSNPNCQLQPQHCLKQPAFHFTALTAADSEEEQAQTGDVLGGP